MFTEEKDTKWVEEGIECIEGELAGLKKQTSQEVKEIFTHLSKMDAKTRLRPRIKQNKGYDTFSICWRKIKYFNNQKPRATIAKEIRKGRGFLVPKARLLVHCRNCESWEAEYILEKEKLFSEIREKVHLLSGARQALKKYIKSKQARSSILRK